LSAVGLQYCLHIDRQCVGSLITVWCTVCQQSVNEWLPHMYTWYASNNFWKIRLRYPLTNLGVILALYLSMHHCPRTHTQVSTVLTAAGYHYASSGSSPLVRYSLTNPVRLCCACRFSFDRFLQAICVDRLCHHRLTSNACVISC
jgi:hypothetical protein